MFLGDVVMQCNDIYWKTLVSVYLYNYIYVHIYTVKEKGKVNVKSERKGKTLWQKSRRQRKVKFKKQDLKKISETEFKKWKPDKNQVFGTMRMRVWQKLAGNSSLPPPLSCNIKQTSSSWQSSSSWWRSRAESCFLANIPRSKEYWADGHESWLMIDLEIAKLI